MMRNLTRLALTESEPRQTALDTEWNTPSINTNCLDTDNLSIGCLSYQPNLQGWSSLDTKAGSASHGALRGLGARELLDVPTEDNTRNPTDKSRVVSQTEQR